MNIKKIVIRAMIAIASIILLVLVLFLVLLLVKAPAPSQVTWGVNFSEDQAVSLGLDWKQNYLALLQDMGVKHFKLLPQWDSIETSPGVYDFSDTDWQLQQAAQYGADVIYVTGMKSGRWPECHVPAWAQGLSKAQQQAAILDFVKTTVLRYKDSPSIAAWQAENEPLFDFGNCPWYDAAFLQKEVQLIKSLDPSRPVLVSDSGEQSLWWNAAGIGDEVGTTMYRKVWFTLWNGHGFYVDMPIPPSWYWIKAQLVQKMFGKRVINVELQAEPWAYKLYNDVPLAEQDKTMNPALFLQTVAYARKTGFDTFYFWGAEWWYWLKEKQNDPQIWNEAKTIIQQSK